MRGMVGEEDVALWIGDQDTACDLFEDGGLGIEGGIVGVGRSKGEGFGRHESEDMVVLVGDKANAKVSVSVERVDVFGFLLFLGGLMKEAFVTREARADMACGAQEGFFAAYGVEFIEVLFGFEIEGV